MELKYKVGDYVKYDSVSFETVDRCKIVDVDPDCPDELFYKVELPDCATRYWAYEYELELVKDSGDMSFTRKELEDKAKECLTNGDFDSAITLLTMIKEKRDGH